MGKLKELKKGARAAMTTAKKYEHIRGFNYQPSYGSSALEVWRQFDEKIIDIELARGKKYFPKWNAVYVYGQVSRKYVCQGRGDLLH